MTEPRDDEPEDDYELEDDYEPEDEYPPEEGDATGGVIPYKNGAALIAYYLGVFSLIPCFPIGIAAFILGLKGLKAAKERPVIRGQVHAWIGIILGGLFALVWLIGTLGVVFGYFRS